MAKETIKFKVDLDKLSEVEGQNDSMDIIIKLKDRGFTEAAERLYNAIYKQMEKKPHSKLKEVFEKVLDTSKK